MRWKSRRGTRVAIFVGVRPSPTTLAALAVPIAAAAGIACGYELGASDVRPPVLRTVAVTAQKSQSIPVVTPAPSSAPIPKAPEAQPTPEMDPRNAPTCANVFVRGIVAAPNAAWSLAIVNGMVRRRGERVGDARVLHVARDRVWLARLTTPRSYSICQAAIGEEPPRAAETPRDPTPATGGVEARGPREFLVDRAMRDALLDDPSALATQVRIAPDIVSGRAVGATLAFVRRGSVLEKLGLKTGDKLRAANGVDLTSPEQALTALARIRDAPHVTLSIVRDGAPMQIDYDVR
jgi:general secretion pathway protein C